MFGIELGAICTYIITIYLVVVTILLVNYIYNTSVPDLTDKHVMVTGGSSGIGKAVAILAAKKGAHVTIISRDIKKLDAALVEIKSVCVNPTLQKITSLPMDVTQSYEITEKTLNNFESHSCPVDIFINCAGTCVCGTTDEDSESNYRHMLNLNVMGTILPTKAIAKSMMNRKKGGTIVITASLGACLGIYGMGAYCTSKWALRGFACTLHQELAPHNIAVAMCLPPDTDTPGFEKENEGKPDVTKQICEGASGVLSPDDVARKLLSDALNGRFFSTSGIEGNILLLGSAGFSPISAAPEVILQILLSGVIRMGGGHHHKFPKMPDWRIYKVEEVPELMRVKNSLAGMGLKDPWLRNEVWRFDRKAFGTPKERIVGFLFRGFKWGLLAAVITVGIEKAFTPSHEHGHDGEHASH